MTVPNVDHAIANVSGFNSWTARTNDIIKLCTKTCNQIRFSKLLPISLSLTRDSGNFDTPYSFIKFI